MASRALLLLAVLMAAPQARAQLSPLPGIPAATLGQPSGPAQLDPAGRASALTTMAAGSTVARSLAARAADRIDVRDYGAKCDASTDDGPAFNAAINAARARVMGGGPATVRLTWSGCNAMIRTTINLTGIASTSLAIDGSGGLLLGATAGKPVIDAMHSQSLSWDRISIFGEPGADSPNIGIQIGRTDTHDPVDNQHFLFPAIYGYFSFAAFYNLGSEVSGWTHPYFANFTAAAKGHNPPACFALVEDADNHWNIGSQFVAQTIAPDTFLSHDDNLFTNPQIVTSAGCTPLFEGGGSGHSYIGGYIENGAGNATTNVASGYMVELWNPANSVGFAINNLDFANMHMEQEPTDIFYITGGNTAPVMYGLRWEEHIDQAANSIFKLDPAITAITINDLVLRVANTLVAGSKVFDDPSKFTTSGLISLSNAAMWNAPAGSFSGMANLAGQVSFTGAALKAGVVASGGPVTAPGFSTGSDPGNGNIELGATASSTPYIDFNGKGAAVRLANDAAGHLLLGGGLSVAGATALNTLSVGGSQTTGTLNVNGTVTATSSLNAPCAAAGFDPTNGAMQISCGATGTPYLQFGGIGNVRFTADSAAHLTLNGGLTVNTSLVTGSFIAANGGFSAFGATPVTSRTDISGGCGGAVACQKMAALLISLGLATGTVTP